jgi:hypothetical protein
MPLWLDPKGRKDQGGEEIGYLRSISAKIFETRSVPAVRRSNSEDFLIASILLRSSRRFLQGRWSLALAM